VIAAGIEDSDQRAALQNQRVPVGQGYLFSKPHEAEEIDRYSKTSRFSPGSRCRPNDERSSVVRGRRTNKIEPLPRLLPRSVRSTPAKQLARRSESPVSCTS